MISQIDFTQLINWLFEKLLIPLIVAVLAAVLGAVYQRRRDDTAWEREKQKLGLQYQHDLRQEILPQIWAKLVAAVQMINEATFPRLSMELQSIADAIAFDFQKQSRRTAFDAEEGTASPTSSDAFKARREQHLLQETTNRISDFHQYLVEKNPFIDAELRVELERTDRIFQDTRNRIASLNDLTDASLSRVREQFVERITGPYVRIEKLIHESTSST